ncbi:MAG: enoyl-CoA hydratase [Rhodospirillaceae bacterium]
MPSKPEPSLPPCDDTSLVTRHGQDGVATLTLNRPKTRNALSSALIAELQRTLDSINDDPGVRVVVLAGAGPVFCAGHDLRELRDNPGAAACQALFSQCARLMQTITRLRQPVIARVHGVATAAGCQLVATCDLAVAGAGTRFATPGVNIGLFCSTPMVALSRAIGRKAALAMLLTGDTIDAVQARDWGLINSVVPDADLDDAVAGLAARIAAKSPLTLAIGKAAFYRQIDLDLAAAYADAAQVMTRNMLADDAQEGITAFLDKRPPVWRGS